MTKYSIALNSTNLNQKLFIVIFLVSISNLYCKNSLEGKWFCHKVIYQDGKDLEVNHPLFASFLSYEFTSGKAYISINYEEKGVSSKYTVLNSELHIGIRKFSFSFDNKFLVLKEHGDELSYYFLRKSDFLIENNLYQETYFIKENDTIFHRSFSLNPEFYYETSFSNYLRKSIYSYSKTSAQRHQLKGSFVLTRNNEILDIMVEQGINKSFDKSFRKVVQDSEKYWKNSTGKNILIVQKFNFFEQGKYFIKKENWDFYHHVKKADDYYKTLDFISAIDFYEQALDTAISENEFTHIMLRDMSRNLGISYLATGKIEKACESFRIVGDEHDFNFRNFLLKFCK
ncbi:hypothetical protein JM81_2405 [Maribacter sp. MAR_2009_72]|nr:hypothetical protein JM81_2405 [Maribacter sp. MAR_2009_72]